MRAGTMFNPPTPDNQCAPCRGVQMSPAGVCMTPAGWQSRIERGQMPIAMLTCPDDVIIRTGRINAAWVTKSVFQNFWDRGADFSPSVPLQATATYSGAPVTMTLSASADEDLRVAAIILDIYSNNNTAPGLTSFTLGGTFESYAVYAQSLQVQTGHIGGSRVIVLPTREVEGGAYPSLLKVNPATLIIGAADAVPVTETAHTITCQITSSISGTSFVVQTVTPVTDLFYQVQDAFNSTLRMGG